MKKFRRVSTALLIKVLYVVPCICLSCSKTYLLCRLYLGIHWHYSLSPPFNSAVEWQLWFGNSKKMNFWNLRKVLLWHVGNIINFNNSTQKSIQINFLMAFSIHEIAPFCLFCHFLLFLFSVIKTDSKWMFLLYDC